MGPLQASHCHSAALVTLLLGQPRPLYVQPLLVTQLPPRVPEPGTSGEDPEAQEGSA